MPFVRRTRATFRRAEFGFFGVTVKTRVQTPRFCGAPRSAGVFIFAFGVARPLRISWLTVGTVGSRSLLYAQKRPTEGAGPCPPSRWMVAKRLTQERDGKRSKGRLESDFQHCGK